MRAVVGFLALALIVALVVLGVLLLRWSARKALELRALSRYRRLVAGLEARAVEHVELGDPFAVIALDEIRKSNINPPRGLQ
ncbi:hypothetical protein Sme01_04080 [Sphaerisporangium melleum]|uniref:Uncharacterized protein n=1 Tax=Sphaerisporangium melleum TaxID=321316 RepID=A0A917VC99_9ACTN|nr:hypothetical protein [Sphaerisporangium melleum]GGK62125.1 hypothetical protein GCM10007964_01630 [Sphaerisporangium melleum]GII67932.1 hypothetical protein Sme01_04080 [Sphaerisporangium melleum]